MSKIKSLADLKKMKDDLKNRVDLREKGENVENLIQVKVSMATCGIASGAKKMMDIIIEELGKQKIDNVVVTQTGCMGLCYAEPTLEVTIPNKEPVIFGYVDSEKALEIVNKYIKNGELITGIIPAGYQAVE